MKSLSKETHLEDPEVQYNRGVAYAFGLGVEKDEKKAVTWYRKAADQGYEEAQFYLGMCYENGTGVEKNEKEAMVWYQKAVQQGSDEARKAIEQLLINSPFLARNLYTIFGGSTAEAGASSQQIATPSHLGSSL